MCAAHTSEFWNLKMRSYWANQITTAIYSIEVVPLSFKYNLSPPTIYYEGWHHETPPRVPPFLATPPFPMYLFATEQFALIITEFLFCF